MIAIFGRLAKYCYFCILDIASRVYRIAIISHKNSKLV